MMTMNYTHSEFGTIRAAVKDGIVYIPVYDVAGLLGHKNGTTNLASRISENHKKLATIYAVSNRPLVYAQASAIVALLDTMSKSKRAAGVAAWLKNVVIPAAEKQIENDDGKHVEVYIPSHISNNFRQLATEIDSIGKEIEILKPKADYTDRVLRTTTGLTAREIAPDFDMTAQQLNKALHEAGFHYKQGRRWIPYAKYLKQGLFTQEVTPFGTTVQHYNQACRRLFHQMLDPKYPPINTKNTAA